ncbi:MAG: hypothetical protein FWD17_17415, partial [Polyangiaceae bacterium]|nr:hypothetical protein [Polyangiaceae bacterium]
MPALVGLVACLSHCTGDDNTNPTSPSNDSGTDSSVTNDGSTSDSASSETGSQKDDGSAEGPDAGDAGDAMAEDSSPGTGEGGAGDAGDGGTEDGGDAGDGGATTTINGVVASVAFTPGSKTEPTITAGYFTGAKVCIDANGNGKCDTAENPVTTDSKGTFTLTATTTAGLIADIGTDATNTASSKKNASRNVFRASADQVAEDAGHVVLSPLSTEVV